MEEKIDQEENLEFILHLNVKWHDIKPQQTNKTKL